MSPTSPMSSADAAWFHMDRPTNHMVINAVLTLDGPIDVEDARALVHDRIVGRFPRFRQVVVDGGALGGLRWQDDALFDLDLHVHRIALPTPGDQDALQDLVADLMTHELDPARPLWEMYLVEGYGDGSALIARMHHCIADGIALARVMLTLTDSADDSGAFRPGAEGQHRGPLSAVTDPLRAAAGLLGRVAGTLAHETARTALHPEHLLELGREARDDISALATILTAADEKPSALKGELGIAQRVAWTPALSLPDVKETAHATGTTVNDVLLAALSGSLARFLQDHGDELDELHIMVPFNLRALDEPLPAELGNRFGLIILGLPTGPLAPGERLAEVAERMDAIKRSRQPAVSYAVLGAMGRAPVQVEERLIDLFSAKSSSVVTNVPGPRDRLHLAGVAVRDVLFWAPCAGSVGMSVSIFSYCDTVTVGFMTHASLVPDPSVLARAMADELRVLREASAKG